MNFYEKISLILAFLIGVVIFFWSNVSGIAGGIGGSDLLPTLYHFGIFALLSSFLFLCFYNRFTKGKILFAFLLLILYAVLDEVHQIYSPGRSCSLHDFLTDAFGIAAGFLFIVLFGKFLKWIRR